MPEEEKKAPKKQDAQLQYFGIVWYPGGDALECTEKEFEDRYATKFVAALKHHCTRYICQLERGEKLGKLHMQGFAFVEDKKRPKAFAKLLGSDTLPGVSVSRCSTAGKDALARYCMKVDTRVAGPWADRATFLGHDLITKLCPWQQSIVDLLATKPHARKLYWFYDKIGGAGKSSFAKYMMFHHQVPCLTFGDSKDLLYVVKQFQNKPAYMFDLSKTKGGTSSMSDIYAALESVKNGYFVSCKYESSIVLMQTPHVIVFSNHLPVMSALSVDRWNIVHMNELGLRSQRSQEINSDGPDCQRSAPELAVDAFVRKSRKYGDKKNPESLDGLNSRPKKKRKISRIALDDNDRLTPPAQDGSVHKKAKKPQEAVLSESEEAHLQAICEEEEFSLSHEQY